MTRFAKMSGEQRFTEDEVIALQALAERGWTEFKKDRDPAKPYGAIALTPRCRTAMITAMDKLDHAKRRLQDVPKTNEELEEEEFRIRPDSWEAAHGR